MHSHNGPLLLPLLLLLLLLLLPPNGSSIKISLLSVSLTFYLPAVFSNKSLLFAPTRLGQATFFHGNLDGLKIGVQADRSHGHKEG